MSLDSQPVRVATGADEEGCLLFSDGRLVAVLVRLSQENEIAPGQWFYEAGFGALDGRDHPTFATLDDATRYVEDRIAEARRRRGARG